MGGKHSKPKNPIKINQELSCGEDKNDPSVIVKTRIKAASDAILENINNKYTSISTNYNNLPESERANSLFATAFDYQEFGKGDSVDIQTQFKNLLIKNGLDLNALCKSHLEKIIKDMVDKTNKLTDENRSTQYIIDKLTNDLSVYKTTLHDINDKKKKSDEILTNATNYVDYMIQNIKDYQNEDLETLLLSHNKTMDTIKNLYSSDIINKTLYEQYLKEYRDQLYELSVSLLKYYDELINSINIGYQKEQTAINTDHYNELYDMVKHENDTFTSMQDFIKDLYSGDGKNVEYELQYVEQSKLAMLVLWYLYYIMAVIGIYFMIKNVNIQIYTKMLIILIIVFYPQILLYLELYVYKVLSYINNKISLNIL